MHFRSGGYESVMHGYYEVPEERPLHPPVSLACLAGWLGWLAACLPGLAGWLAGWPAGFLREGSPSGPGDSTGQRDFA